MVGLFSKKWNVNSVQVFRYMGKNVKCKKSFIIHNLSQEHKKWPENAQSLLFGSSDLGLRTKE
jgi:hypothetical protein